MNKKMSKELIVKLWIFLLILLEALFMLFFLGAQYIPLYLIGAFGWVVLLEPACSVIAILLSVIVKRQKIRYSKTLLMVGIAGLLIFVVFLLLLLVFASM